MNNEAIINVVICYNNADEVIEYYKEILSLSEGSKVGYVVVINSISESESNCLCSFSKENQHVYIYNPGKNLGYMNGLLYGYRSYREQTGLCPQFVIMSNTDIAFQDKMFLVNLSEKKYDNNVSCIGPSILVSELNSFDNPVSDSRYTAKQLKKWIKIHKTPILRELYVTAAFIKPKIIKRKKDLVSREVYELHGCFFVLTYEFAEWLKEKTFGVLLYSEETFVAENAYRRHMKGYYDASLEIIHKEHSTTRKLKPTKRAYYISESLQWILDSYFIDNDIYNLEK